MAFSVYIIIYIFIVCMRYKLRMILAWLHDGKDEDFRLGWLMDTACPMYTSLYLPAYPTTHLSIYISTYPNRIYPRYTKHRNYKDLYFMVLLGTSGMGQN